MQRNGLTRRLVQLYSGLALYGLSGGLLVRSRLGLDPWDFHQGLAKHVGVAIGTVVVLVGAAVLLLWIPLRQRPGLGTISNAVLVGICLNVSLDLLPHPQLMVWRVAFVLAGILLCGVATGMYIGARFGPGPRDGLMTALAARTHRSIRVTRTALEATVLVVGWLLGGTVGIGTVAFAVAIGPLAQLFLPMFHVAELGAELGAESRAEAGPTPARGPRRRHGPAKWRSDRSPSRTPGADRRTPVGDRPAIRG